MARRSAGAIIQFRRRQELALAGDRVDQLTQVHDLDVIGIVHANSVARWRRIPVPRALS
ncbi:hypothetical protein DVS28_a0754 [Euzebya pacifica]|uniref:Uncharacterized protein n=1 Tax=Euzebya pacifica TaxID=1608957 RepID=A0A346XTA8_9ACTN|nr:hypothetical protein DVS28_a0754 [Euzebya pacifica]